jgi:hypothetical protein
MILALIFGAECYGEDILLCATSVFSMSLWLTNPPHQLTTETQRTQRLHREAETLKQKEIAR